MAPPTATRRKSPQPSSEEAKNAAEEEITRSDNDSGNEKAARDKLRDTTIDQQVSKKRSIEDFKEDNDDEDEDDKENTRHVRKRSREAAELPKDVEAVATKEATPEMAATEDEDMSSRSGLTSPKGKRGRASEAPAETEASFEERRTKRAKDSGSPEAATDMSEAAAAAAAAATDASSTTTNPPATVSGFANTSATSPFATSATKAAPQTSDEKFKSSGFGSFAAASVSPFGAAAPKSSSSPFGAAGSSAASPWAAKPAGSTTQSIPASPWAAKPATATTQPSAFAPTNTPAPGVGSSNAASPFATANNSLGGSSVFSKGTSLGTSAFGALSSQNKLSSFATGPTPTISGLSSKPAKPFGASADDTDEEDAGDDGDTEADSDNGAGAKSPHNNEDSEKDKRFYKQIIETGEEGETTTYQQRAKLYAFDKEGKKWVERGVGVLKLNISDVPSKDGSEEDAEEVEGEKKVHARLLLRADGSQRVVLNSPIVKGAAFGDATEPKGGNILFVGRLAGGEGLDTLQVKMNAERAKTLWHCVQELQDRLA